MSTTIDHLVALLHAVGLSLALVIVGMPAPAAARGPSAPTTAPEKTEPSPSAEPAPSSAGPSTVEAALEAGNLDTAMRLASEARHKDPTPAAWRLEAEVAERRGNLAAAETAYRGELKALPEADAKARARAEQDLARVQAKSRGTVAGEPKSQHRAELDRKWAGEAKASPSQKKKRRVVSPPSPRAREDRIVTKWYFWVTVGAIVASAAAVTAIAIRASRDDEPDALGLEAGPRSMGPALLRF